MPATDYPIVRLADAAGNVVNPGGASGSGGSTGTDYSANKPAATGVVLATIPANPNRNWVSVQNQSANDLQVVRDDGAGGQTTTLILASGGAVGLQGASYDSRTFRGRLTVRGPAGSQFAAYED